MFSNNFQRLNIGFLALKIIHEQVENYTLEMNAKYQIHKIYSDEI